MIANWKEWEGRLVNGEFPLQRSLGGSDHSAVFLVEKSAGGRSQTAIRFMDANSEGAGDQIRRWEAAWKLDHPNLMRIFKAGRCEIAGNDLFYALSEYAEEDLSQIVPERALTVEEARQVLESVLSALAWVHGQGLVHGSLKPSNILAVGDTVKISSDTLRPAGKPLIGRARNSAYDAPEVEAGMIAPPADVWSLGVTLVEALTQRFPVLDSQQKKQPTLPRGIPQPFREIVENCLQVDPARRWTVAQIAAHLRGEKPEATRPATAAVPQTAAHASSPIPPVQKQSAKWPYAIALVVAVVVAVLIVRPKPAVSPVPVQTAQPQDAPTAGAPPSTQPGVVVSAPGAAHPAAPVGPATSEGEVVQRVMPQVSPGARRTITGRIRVVVKVNVDEAGNVTEARLKSPGPSRYFAGHALEAAREWKFRPPLVNGQAAASQWDVRFTFSRRGIDSSAGRSKL